MYLVPKLYVHRVTQYCSPSETSFKNCLTRSLAKCHWACRHCVRTGEKQKCENNYCTCISYIETLNASSTYLLLPSIYYYIRPRTLRQGLYKRKMKGYHIHFIVVTQSLSILITNCVTERFSIKKKELYTRHTQRLMNTCLRYRRIVVIVVVSRD